MTPTNLTVLAVDDDAGDAEILRRHLDDIPNLSITFLHAADRDAAQAALARPDVELIFLDHLLGAETGADLLHALRSAGDLRPVIMLTGHGDETLVAAVMRSGADDYLSKSQLNPLTLRRAIDNSRAQHVRRKFEARNRDLLEDLQSAKFALEVQNRRLAELYNTAHQFVDHVSHEFRTPLTVIKEFAAIMRDGLIGEVNGEQREYLEIVVNRVNDLTLLVDDMLDISKLEAGMLGISRRDCRLTEVVERVRPILEARARIAKAGLEIHVAADLPTIFCDPEKVGRVLINLTINALKFSRDNGHVYVSARADPEQKEVRVAVRDEGPGIAPESLQTLFQRFRQVAESPRAGLKGFGLGLSIAKELVQLNLGELSVASELGQGSTFSFTVPWTERGALLERYLGRVEQFRAGSDFVSLVHVRTTPDADAALLEETEYLLQRQMRRSDLLLPVQPYAWVLIAPANQSDIGPLLERLRSAHAEACLNRPGTPLPELDLRCAGTWNIHNEREALRKHVEVALRSAEPAYA
jgi:signal transduction histidine kinase